MSDPYRILGVELSPYSVKVRSYFRYKGIPHVWVVRNRDAMPEFQKHARLPLIPLVVEPDGSGALQDSTPILDTLEARFPDPTIHPTGPCGFLSALLEEYADEWGNKWMFHYRWWRDVDRRSAGERLARLNLPEDATPEAIAATTEAVVSRMVPRLRFVGSSEQTKNEIETSFRTVVGLLERHLATRAYLFGGRPAFADFGLFGQLYNCLSDPTAGAILREDAPAVVAWIERMLDPRAEAGAEFEAWEPLEQTLEPLLRTDVAARFLPWSAANARALEAGEDRFTVELPGGPFAQDTQKYHARSLAALRKRLASVSVSDRTALDAILARSGCLPWLDS